MTTRCDCGRITPEAAYCGCGHLVAVHALKTATKTRPERLRGGCTHMDATGQCPCKGPR